METKQPSDLTNVMVQVDRITQWNAFHRLQELSIPCECRIGQPLQVWIDTPTAALQLWSVIQQLTVPRQHAIDHLENCWQQGF